MDRETENRITKLEIQAAQEKEWDKVVRDVIIKTVSWLVVTGIAGALYGWHLPENARKFIADWVSK